jgi:ribosome-binding factor A
MRKNSIKNTRINGEVQKELSTLISREIKDPRINPMTSVVHVEVAPDLKTAKVYISVLGDDESKKSTLLGLKSAASYMRGQLAKTLNLRNTPELTFVIDNSIEYGVHMSKLIDEVNKKVVTDETGDDYYDDDEEDQEDEEDNEDHVND